MRIPRKTKKMLKKRWLKRCPIKYRDLKVIKSSISKEFEFEGNKVWGCKVEWLKPLRFKTSFYD
jgi:hypothetical protein